MEYEEALPSAICQTCFFSAIKAAEFRTLVQRTEHHWTNTVQLLQQVPHHKNSQSSDKSLAIVYNSDINKAKEIWTLVQRTEHQKYAQRNDKILAIVYNDINIPDECNKSKDGTSKQPIIKRFGKMLDCQCKTCGKKFQYTLLLYKHLKESADLVRACHICAEVMSRNDLVKHLKDEHSMKPYVCEQCPALFLNVKPYSEHLLKAHAPGTLTCGDCSRSFKSRPAFYAHQGVHSTRSCPNCDKTFQNQSCYTHHVTKCCNLDFKKDQHEPKLTITLKNKKNKRVKIGKRGSTQLKCVCDYCKKTFCAKKHLVAHIQIVHTKKTHRPCTVCGKIFAAAHMTTHLRSHANYRYECDQCGAILKTRLGITMHLRLHSGERPYKCKHCGESFSSSSRRAEHMRNKHLRSQIVLKHVCALCPARFRLPSKLNLHVRDAHKDEKGDPIWFMCAKCHEKFTKYQSLLIHFRNHKE